jgi:hypothetical protein
MASIVAIVLGGCATSGAKMAETTAPAPKPSHELAQANAEALPDDLGAPLPQAEAPAAAGPLSIDMPIGSIAEKPYGRAVLEKDLPGLCERPEFVMFKGMSLKALAGMSGGRISTAKLNQLQADLVKVSLSAAP